MTPQQIETAARARHNAATSTFWSQDELFKVMYEAEMELATRALVIEALDTSVTTVNGTRGYSFPTGVIGIKRMEINGRKIQKIDDRQDDMVTLSNSADTTTGDPQYYEEWNDVFYLRPIPSAAQTVTMRVYKEPTLLTTASTTMSTKSRYHIGILNYVIGRMFEKDDQPEKGDRYLAQWEQFVEKTAKEMKRKLRRGDAYAVVKDEDMLATTFLGSG